jgi:hypothetical protein
MWCAPGIFYPCAGVRAVPEEVGRAVGFVREYLQGELRWECAFRREGEQSGEVGRGGFWCRCCCVL